MMQSVGAGLTPALDVTIDNCILKASNSMSSNHAYVYICKISSPLNVDLLCCSQEKNILSLQTRVAQLRLRELKPTKIHYHGKIQC